MNRVVQSSHLLLALYLASLLSLPKVQSPLAALVCLTAIAGSQWRTPPTLGQRLRDSWPMWLPLAGYSMLILGQMAIGHLKLKDSDQLLMFLLTTGVLLSAVPMQAGSLRRWLFPAAAVGAIGAFVLVAWQGWVLDIYRPYGHLGVGSIGSGAIKLGDLAGVLGLFSLLLLVNAAGQPRWQKVLGVIGFASGACALGLTQARGGVVGVVLALFMLVLLLWLRGRRLRRLAGVPSGPASRQQRMRMMMAAIVGGVLVLSSAYFTGQRFADIGPQYERFMAGDQNSEIGQRLAIWGVAWRAGLHAPLTGVGINGLGAEIKRQRESGELPADMLVMYEGAHNEYLSAFAGAGIPGVLVIVMLFVGPLVVGVRRFLDGQQPEAALALVMLTTAYSAYSLTDSMFDRQISMLAYLLLCAWMMSAGRSSVARPGGSDAVSSNHMDTAQAALPSGGASEVKARRRRDANA
ncbi:MAG: O-antigen ligase family protein [Lautropia sp.]|nr:O-antigen ligase family protein [Lautropia sp.]